MPSTVLPDDPAPPDEPAASAGEDTAHSEPAVRPSPGSSLSGSSVQNTAADEPSSHSTTKYLFLKPMPTREEGVVVSRLAADGSGGGSQLWERLLDRHVADGVPEVVRLDHFEVQRLIGRGGMGAVFSGVDTRLGRQVAVKVLSPDHVASASSLDRFRNEARAAARLDHPNIARVFYVGGRGVAEDDSRSPLPFIVFEFVEGTNLRELIRRDGPQPVAAAVSYGLQIAAALRHTAAAGVVHRDIKPSNIIVGDGGLAKLVDLGLARKTEPEATHELTVAGTTLGTFDYISPEQAKDPRLVDVRSDLYSLGCTLYHALAGRPPYPEGTMLQKLLDHQDNVVPDVRDARPQVPDGLAELIRRMMAPRPDDRPQSPEEVLARLDAEADAIGLSRPEAFSVGHRPPRPPRPTLRQSAGWVAAVLVILLGAVFFDGLATLLTPAPRGEPVADLSQIESVEAESGVSDDLADPAAGLLTERTSPDRVFADGEPLVNPRAEAIGGGVTADPGPPPTRPVEPTVPLTATTTGGQKAGTAAAATEVAAPAAAAEPFVLRGRAGDVRFASLEEAARAAADGSTLLVDADGPVPLPSRTVRLSRRSLTLRAAEGRRPVLSRTPRPAAGVVTELPAFDGAAFRVEQDAALAVEGVDLEALAPGAASEPPWALFELVGDARLNLTGVGVTVTAPEGRAAGLCRHAPDDTLSVGADRSGGRLELRRCLVRGDLGLTLWDGHSVAGVTAIDCGLALTQPLAEVRSNAQSVPTSDVPSLLEVALEHVTWVSRASLLRMSAGRGDRVGPVTIDAESCVLSLLGPDEPLIAMRGGLSADAFQGLLSWSGGGNFYTGEVAWRIDADERMPTADVRDFAEWSDIWGPASVGDAVIPVPTLTAGDMPGMPLEKYGPEDFSPAGPVEINPIRLADGTRDAGVDWAALPPLKP